MKKILITGGLGFMGFHLSRYLLQNFRGISITVVDNLSSSRVNFGQMYSQLNVLVEDFKKVTIDEQFDQIYHLASPVGSLGILSKTGFVVNEIIDLTQKVVEVAKQSGAKILFVSSSEVYGHAGIHDETEKLIVRKTFGTRAEYAIGKLASEIILNNLSSIYNLQYNICRPFNVIGEQQCAQIGFVVPTFFEKALSNKDIPVFYDGSQRRSFCAVQDIVRGLVAIQESECNGQVFNIGNDSNIISVLELANEIKSLCRSSSKIVHVDPVEIFGKMYSEAFDKIPNVDKILLQLNWQPKMSLAEILQNIHRSYSLSNENP